MVQVEKIMKLGLHKGPSGVGRPLVVEVGTLCMLPVVNPVAALGGAVGRVYKRSEADTLV